MKTGSVLGDGGALDFGLGDGVGVGEGLGEGEGLGIAAGDGDGLALAVPPNGLHAARSNSDTATIGNQARMGASLMTGP
jgi:hypothetical protein